jgi:DNA-binding response OmpR family regulator
MVPPLHTQAAMATIAIFNSSEDTVEMLRIAFEHAGFQTVGGHVPDVQRGKLDFVEFLRQHDPEVVLIDVSMPYGESWTFVKLLRDTVTLRERAVVLTTTNKAALDDLVGPTDTIEIVGKPYEPEHVVEGVKKARDRPRRAA